MRYAVSARNIKTKFLNISASGVLLISSLGGAVPLLLPQRAFADTVSVCQTGCTYSTIQAGINAASPGDTVNVAAGSYTENVTISKSINLVGVSGTILNVADGASSNGIDITANDVSISGFDIDGPVTSSYTTYPWSGNVSRGIVIASGVTGFSITGNTIQNLRNDLLIDGRDSTGSITNNIIDNSKSGISVQYTDASGITISGNQQGTYGNDWGINLHLNGNFDGTNTNSNPIAITAPVAAQQVVTNLSTSNDDWTVQDQGYTNSNRTAVQVSNGGGATSQGDPLGPIDTIPDGITAVVDGGKVNVASGTYPMTSDTNVNKQVAIEGQSGATITTSGSTQILTFTADDSTLSGFAVTKTDNADQDILGIQANNVTISHDDFSGQYNITDNAGTTRAMVVSTPVTGLNVSDNTFNNLRQPAYINNLVTGTLTNNYVNQTRGWVIVSDTSLTFTGNSWGTNAGGTDISFISQDGSVNNYSCSIMQGITANNNGAVINNQVLTTPCPLAAPTNLTPADGSYTNDPAFNDTWSTVPGAAKYEYRTSNTESGGQLGTIIYSDDSSTSSNYSISGNTVTRGNNGTPDGTYYWQVRAVDASGAAGPWSVISEVTVDTVPPTVPNLSAPADNAHINTPNFTFDWSDSSDANSPITYQWEASLSPNTNPDGSFQSPIASHTLTSSEVASPGTPDGTYYWHVRAVDPSNNISAWTDTWKVTVDSTAPAVPSITFTADNTNTQINSGGLTNSKFFTFNLSNPAADGVDHYQLKYWNNIPGSAFDGESNAWSPTDLNAYSSSLGVYNDNFTQGDGTHYFAFSACDVAGNCSAYSDPFVITYDSTPPATPTGLAFTDSNNNSVADNGFTNVFNGTASWSAINDADHYIYKVWDNITGNAFNGEANAYIADPTTNAQAGSFNQGDGTYTFEIAAVDAAGNTSAFSTPFSVTYDSTNPVVTVDSLSTTNPNPTLTGTVTDANISSVTVKVNGNTYTATISGNTWSATVTDSLGTGTYDVQATATDLAGNIGTDSTTNELTITAVATPTVLKITHAAVTSSTTNTNTGNTGGTGGGTTTGTTPPTTGVLGAHTTTPNSTGTVKGDKTVNLAAVTNGKSSNFLALGWWWLVILAALAGFWWLIAGRRNSDDA